MVFEDSEVTWLESLEGQHGSDMATVLSSAKEVPYKCQHAPTRAWLRFHDATVAIGDGTFAIDLLVDGLGLEGHAPLDGRYRVDDRVVAAAIAIGER